MFSVFTHWTSPTSVVYCLCVVICAVARFCRSSFHWQQKVRLKMIQRTREIEREKVMWQLKVLWNENGYELETLGQCLCINFFFSSVCHNFRKRYSCEKYQIDGCLAYMCKYCNMHTAEFDSFLSLSLYRISYIFLFIFSSMFWTTG